MHAKNQGQEMKSETKTLRSMEGDSSYWAGAARKSFLRSLPSGGVWNSSAWE